ncbi:MAG: HAMP domain-containing histidine kinase [Anaerolineae bacterium]|jgi:signal transduction histidine kinase|nr:HAMP domain-containing histidine kinase [Anaerolineae bacterium]
MQRLNNLSLGLKLIGIAVIVLTVLLVSTILLLGNNTNNLTQELGTERVGEEANIVLSRIETGQRDLRIDADFLASGVLLFQAVGRRSGEDVSEIMNSANQALALDDIDVVDGDGNRLFDLASDANDEEDALLQLSLAGQSRSELFVETIDGEVQLSLVASVPIVSIRGNVLGALQISRVIDNALLDEFAFSRTNIELGLVYGGDIKAFSRSNGLISPRYLANEGRGLQVMIGQGSRSVATSSVLNAPNGLPYVTAHVGLNPVNADQLASLIVLVELGEIATFQSVTLTNTILVFVLLTIISIVLLYAATNFIVIRPIDTLTLSTQQMIEGNYSQRIPVAAKDEVGRLAENFNMMAVAIQQRETSLQAAREQAVNADKVKSAFLASMSHELRTPLNAIINFSKFIRRQIVGPINEEQDKLMANIVDSGQHLLNLINDILDMSKIESDSLRLFIEPNLKFNEILNSALKYVHPILADKPVELVQDIPADLPPMTADRKRLIQILLNILSNAAKFTDEGHIKVSVAVAGEQLKVSIADTGHGIAPEDHHNVFTAFKQTETGLRQGGGTGLGMPICKRLVEIHGGRLWFESELNKGTTFFIELPLHSKQD